MPNHSPENYPPVGKLLRRIIWHLFLERTLDPICNPSTEVGRLMIGSTRVFTNFLNEFYKKTVVYILSKKLGKKFVYVQTATNLKFIDSRFT